MEKQAVLATALVLVALAGCIAPQGAEEVPEELTAAGLAAGGWYGVPARAGPDAPLTAAWFTVPEGAVHPWAHNEDFDSDYDVVAVEAAFVFDRAVTPDAVAVLGFRHEDGMLAPSLVSIATPGMLEYSGGLLMDGSSDAWAPELAPAFYHLAFDDDVDAGERIGLVVGVRAAEDAVGEFLFRVRGAGESDFADDEEPEDDALAFAKAGAAAMPLAVSGTGAGIFAAERLEFSGGLLLPMDVVYQTGDVTVEGGRSPADGPVTTGRHSILRAADPAPEGWGLGSVVYATDNGLGSWSGLVEMREIVAERANDVAAVPPGLFTAFEVASAVAEGSGPARTELVVDVDGTPNSETLMLLQLGIGATVESLLGEPAATRELTTGAGAPLRQDATGWTLQAGDARVMLHALPQA